MQAKSSGAELSPEEEAAGKIVAQQLGGTHDPRDVPGAPDGTHDLDIVLTDGRGVPLDVTSSVDGEALTDVDQSDVPLTVRPTPITLQLLAGCPDGSAEAALDELVGGNRRGDQGH